MFSLAAAMLVGLNFSCSEPVDSNPTADIPQPATREYLAEIKVGSDGNFKYWNQESPALRQLKEFVAMVTDDKSDGYVPPCDRIATFDMDGTLFCETAPTYFNFMAYCHRVLHDSTYTATPEELEFVGEVESYLLENHSISSEWGMSTIDGQNIAFGGMTQQEYSAWMAGFMNSEKVVGLSDLTWGTALYWPMIEAVSYLVANDFRVYVCSGTDRDLCRTICDGIFDIPPYQFISTDVNYVPESLFETGEREELSIAEGYRFNPEERFLRGKSKYLNTGINKIATISREIGQKPILAWGNSSGDYPMLDYATRDNRYPSVGFCILCDDTEREFGNESKAAKCKSECDENGWITVSMRDDWKTIYGPAVKKTSE